MIYNLNEQVVSRAQEYNQDLSEMPLNRIEESDSLEGDSDLIQKHLSQIDSVNVHSLMMQQIQVGRYIEEHFGEQRAKIQKQTDPVMFRREIQGLLNVLNLEQIFIKREWNAIAVMEYFHSEQTVDIPSDLKVLCVYLFQKIRKLQF